MELFRTLQDMWKYVTMETILTKMVVVLRVFRKYVEMVLYKLIYEKYVMMVTQQITMVVVILV